MLCYSVYPGLLLSSIHSFTDKTASVAWDGNWITFIDSMLQLCVICKPKRDVVLPVGVDVININPQGQNSSGKVNYLQQSYFIS